PYGFAVFRDQQAAVGAMQALNGLVFDLEKQSTLYISLAKSNSKSKRSRTDDGRAGSFDKKVRGPPAFSNDAYDTSKYFFSFRKISSTHFVLPPYPIVHCFKLHANE
ncbi:Rna-binding family protein isoform, partial [Thalictrum thalictroides]